MTRRVTITTLGEEAGWKQERVAELKNVGTGTVGKTVRRVVAYSKENRLPFGDISIYQSAPRPVTTPEAYGAAG